MSEDELDEILSNTSSTNIRKNSKLSLQQQIQLSNQKLQQNLLSRRFSLLKPITNKIKHSQNISKTKTKVIPGN